MDKGFLSNLLKGMLSTSFGTGIVIFFHFLSVVLMTRLVSKEDLGLYFLASASINLLVNLGGLGLDLALVRFVSGVDAQVRRQTFASVIAVRALGLMTVGVVFYLAGELVLSFFDQRLDPYVFLIIVLFFVNSLRELFLHLIQGIQRFKQYAVVQILSASSRVILLIVLAGSLDLATLLHIDIVALCLSLLFELFVARDFLKGLSVRSLSREALGTVSRFSAPLYFNNLLTFAYNRSSVFLIGTFLTPISVAAYGIAQKIPDACMRLFRSFIVVYFPNVSELFAQDKRPAARKVMNHSLILTSTLIVFVVLITFLLREEIAVLMFSEEYAEISLALAFLMLNFSLHAISNVMGYSLVSAGNAMAPVRTNVVASAVNIGSGIVLIQRFGYMGAVYALLLMNITSQILYYLQLRRMGIAPRAFHYLRPFLLLAPAIGIDWLLGGRSFIVKALLIVFYVASSVLVIGEIRELFSSARGYVNRLRMHGESA